MLNLNYSKFRWIFENNNSKGLSGDGQRGLKEPEPVFLRRHLLKEY